MISRFISAAILALFSITALFPAGADAACKKAWKTWHDNVRGSHGILRINYQICSRNEQNFRIYRNKDWEGKKNTFEKVDEFTLSPAHPSHSKHFPKFYSSAAGPIEVKYSLTAEYGKGRVHSSGYVKYPNIHVFPIVAETKHWNQYFHGIPSDDDVICLPGKKDCKYVEVSELWTGFCSDIACGPWVRFPGYSEAHRYNAHIPGIGPVIIQLWKGYCPRYNRIEEESKKLLGVKKGGTIPLVNIGKNFPGGLGAEVGVYVPKKGKTMMEAALTMTPIGLGEWAPLVDKDIRISFQLVDKKTGKVIVDAPEKQTWWRTKWKNIGNPLALYGDLKDPLEYELRYKINGVEQPPWGYSGKEGMVTGVGRYPEIGFNGIWKQDEKLAQLIGPAELGMLFDFKVIELYHHKDHIRLNVLEKIGKKSALNIPLSGAAVKGEDKVRGPYTVSAKQSGGSRGNLILEYKYAKAPALNRTYELILKNNGDIHILNTPVIFYPL